MVIFNIHVLRFAHKFFDIDFLFFLHEIIDFLVLESFIPNSMDFF